MYGELEKGDLVWFDPSVGHTLPGEVVEYHRAAQVLTVQAVINGKPQVFTLTSLNGIRRRQDLGQNGVEDMIQLSDLNEASLLWNLKIRYEKELIYTYVGSILVAVNPYRMFDIYGLDMVKKYENQILGTLSPHLFAIGSSAYAALNKTGESQVVVISGESGAGKTESTKLVMQYLAAVNKSPSNLVTEQILEASPLLESFGNAKTVRNDNSSRFGKYLEVHFNKGVITGAKVTEYLLEKSRIVTQAPEERNYHVFYEMLLGLPESQRQSYGLLTPEKYFYLNQGGSCEIDGKVDRDDFQSLLSAMQVLGFTNDEQDTIFRILASVLHLGNVYFHRKQLRHGQEGVEIGSDAEIKWTAHLLKLNPDGIKDALMTKTTEARGERVQTPLTIDQSLDARDAFAKALYHTLFSWLVARINQIVYKGTKRTAAISILDIFGFEDFQENSFEQLCINYANENLQFYFNKHIFKLEQIEYAKEKIQWQTINYTDNVPIINLIAKKPVGILHLLDDESNFPKATDVSFLEKCHYNHALDELYSRPRMSSSEFGLKHYAGQVWYNVEGFLDKNRDTLRSDVIELLISSKIKLISTMFENYRNTYEGAKTINKANGRFVTMKPRTPTVAARFHDSLQQLLALMDKCNPWFVRCIKPNNEKAPMKFDMPIVVEQLRYTGMLETIRIRKTGYPVRLKFSQFYDRYRYFLPDRGATVARGTPYRELCRFILEIKECNSSDYQLGTTRVFLRENLERDFEKERSEILHKAALTLQTNIRGYLARRKYQNIKRSTLKIQSAVRGWRARKKYKIVRRGIIATQARFRGRRQRKRYLELSAELKRRAAAEKAARDRAKVKAQKEEQERNSRAVAGVNHLEIPAELAFIFSKLDDWEQTHTERNLVKVVGNVSSNPKKLQLPADIDHHAFTKFTNIYFKSHVWGMKREPIKTPFLAKAKDMDYQDSLALFKLILRFMNDNNLNGKKEIVLGDYIVNKGLSNEKLRDEILCQLCNQTWNNSNDANNERGWLLMANCISVFPPSQTLYKYLLKYVSDHAYNGYKALCQRKLLQIQSLELPLARCYPPNILEWRSNRKRVNMALPLHFADGEITTVDIDSWSTGEDLASFAIKNRGIQESNGWTVILSTDAGATKEAMGCDYVMDLISEMEIAPAFPVCKNSFLMSHDKNAPKSQINDDLEVPIITPRRPANPPPQPPVRKQSRELLEETIHTPRKPVDRIRSQSKDHTVESGLSRKSALNDRYFEDGRSRSLDNLLDPEVTMPYKLDNLGLSRSRLNERYHSADKIQSTSSIIEGRAVTNQEYMSKSEILLEENLESVSQRGENHRAMELNGSTAGLNDNQSDVLASSSNVNIDFDYQDIASRSEDDKGSFIKGHPRFIKSQYAGKRAAPGSHSSRAYIEKSDYTAKSSALSDTSEAPSLASHVRRVRVPSQASDVDQFLDDLFMPVLDGNLDELSDARSLAASIKGGGNKKVIESEDDPNDNEVATLTSTASSTRGSNGRELENVDDYITNLFQPIFVNDSVNRLVSASTLAQKIKGGGRGVQDKTNAQPGFTPISNMTSPTTIMPGMMSPPPVMMPLFAPTAQSSASLSFMGPGGVASAAQTMSAANFYPTSPDAMMQPTMLQSIPIYNIQGLNMPNQQMDSNLLAYQQNLQRAFLQSAMAQNIQIQQQLLAQNQALQQLLQQQAGPPLKSQQQTPVSFATENSEHYKRDKDESGGPPLPPKSKATAIPVQSTITAQSYGIPAPPPLPPPPDTSDPHNRPFIDPYGRAKTVRIGKWRWPPPQDGSQEESDSFFQFKMRQQRKTTPQKQSSQDSTEDRTEGIEWEEFDLNIVEKTELNNRKLSAPTRKESKEHKNAVKSFELGTQRPSPGSIGKLRISSEMRHKLEMVTANHSVRSTAKTEKPSLSQVPNLAPPKKLEDNRKMLLQQQLAGRWGSVDSVDQVTTGGTKEERPDVQATNIVRSQVERMEKTSPSITATTQNNSQWRPNPPPAPVAPQNVDGQHKGPQPPSRSSSFYSISMNATTRPRSPPPPIQPVKRNNFNGSSDIFGIIPKDVYSHQDFNNRTSNRRDDLFDSSVKKRDSFNNLRNREDFMHSGENLYKRKIEMDRRSSISEQIDRIEIEESSEFLQPMDIPPPTSIQRHYEEAETKLYPQSTAAHFTYNRIPWKLLVRKEVFSPNEKLTNPLAVHLVFCQIVRDVLESGCIRITREQRTDMKKLLDGYGINLNNIFSQSHKQTVKKNIVELAKEWDTYFCRLYPVSGGQTNRSVQYLGLSHSGVRLIRREKNLPQDHLQILESFQFDDIVEISVPKSSAIEILLRNGGRFVLYTHRAPQIHSTIQRFIVETEKGAVEYVRGVADHMHRNPAVLNFRKGDIIKILAPEHYVEKGWLYGASGDRRGNFPCDLVEPLSREELITAQSMHQQYHDTNRVTADASSSGWTGRGALRPTHSLPIRNHNESGGVAQASVNDGKHSLLQFAIHHFRQSPEKFEMLKTSDGSISGSLKVIESKNKKNKEKGKGGSKDSSEWTWKEQVDLVKFTAKPIEQSLLQLDPELSDLAVECFLCLMRYMGDLPMPTDVSEVKCVYTILMHCHKYEQLRDEVYCQLMKQTTNNKSIQQESCQRGWRLFSIIAAYFSSSDTLKPFLFKYLETAAYDKRRAYHGTAMVCLQNLRKTFKYGGRKNVPSVEEITAISAGRNSKRQIYRLPGGTEKVVNTKSTTVVQDVIEELCVMINVVNPQEMEEFSVYCIVEGDTFTMPLAREEYILDVTTELHKNHQVFYLIFCRSVWYFPLRLDSHLYVEVVFNQIAPDYLEGLLLILPGESLEQEVIYDISKIAALLHRAADLTEVPTMKETKFLLPKPALTVRDVKPSQWVNMVQSSWQDCESLTNMQAKAQVLETLSKWPLFGSSFFAVKKVPEPKDRTDHILALNRNGVHFIDLMTHETLLHYPFSEVISTRKVKSEDGTLFLDMKCGNLMQQRITRLQTDQAHEISRLIRQYITMQQSTGEAPSKQHGPLIGTPNSRPAQMMMFATSCMIYKRVTDDEANKLFYFLQKYSREWPLLNSVTWEENGAIFTDITYGGYIIIIIGLIIGQCSGELPRWKKTENFFLVVGALLFIAAGSLELAALESVEERLVDNAAILGVLSLLTGFLFIIDLLSASKRRKKETLQIFQRYAQSKSTQTEEDKLTELTKTNYLNGNIQNGKAHTFVDMQDKNRIPRNAVKLLPSSPLLGDSGLTSVDKVNDEYEGRVLYPAELPVIDGSEIKTHEGRVKSTESFLRSEKGFYPKFGRIVESDRSNNNFFIPTGYVLVPSEQMQGKSKSKSDSGIGDSPTPPGYAKIIPDAKGKPGYVIVPIDHKDTSRKVQSPTTLRDSPEFYYLGRQDGKLRSPTLYRSSSVINSSDVSDTEEPIKERYQKMPSKYNEAEQRVQKFAPQSEDSSDEHKMSYPSEIHFRPDSRHSSRSLQGPKEWRQYPKGKVNEGYLDEREKEFSFVPSGPYHSGASSAEKPKSILRFDYGRSSKKETGLYLPKDARCDSLDSQKIAEELKNLREITKPDLDLNLEKENKFLKERLKFETQEKKKLRHELEDKKKRLNETEEEKNRRISEREEQYFGIKDLKQSHKEDSGRPKITQLDNYLLAEAQKERKGANEVNEKLKQKYLEHESKATREAQEFRDLIDERFHFLHEEDKQRKNLSPRRIPVEKPAMSEVLSAPDLTSHSSSLKFQKSDSDEINSTSTDDEIKLRVETPGSYKSEALFWLGGNRGLQDKSNTPTTPGSPGYVLYTAQNWPDSPSPEDRFQFSAKEAQQLSLRTSPKTPVQEQSTSEKFDQKKNSAKLHLLDFEEVSEKTEQSTSPRKGLLVRKVDFPKEPVVEVKKPAVVHGSTSTWRRWLYPKPKVQHTKSVPT